MMSPANSGLPFAAVTKPEMQAPHGNRFGVVPSPTGPWQLQVNGMPASSIPGAQNDARAPLQVPLLSNASTFPHQLNRPPSAASPDARLQNATSATLPVGYPPAVYASPAQVSLLSSWSLRGSHNVTDTLLS